MSLVFEKQFLGKELCRKEPCSVGVRRTDEAWHILMVELEIGKHRNIIISVSDI